MALYSSMKAFHDNALMFHHERKDVLKRFVVYLVYLRYHWYLSVSGEAFQV